MREDMEYIGGVLDELEAVVREASRVPMRKGRVMVDRADFLVVLDELRGSLPPELAEAEGIRRECGAIVREAEEEAMVLETESFRRARRRAQENFDRAERYAKEIEDGSEVYQERVMGQLEGWFQDSLVSVAESRQELAGTPARQAPRQRPPEQDTFSEERPVEQPSTNGQHLAPEPERDAVKDEGHGSSSWRANSA
jgi:hypothetical protein